MAWRATTACLATLVTLAVPAGSLTAPPPAAAGPAAAVPEAAAVPAAAVPATAVLATAARVSTDGGNLNVRSNASTLNRPVGGLANGASVTPQCQLGGERIAGTVRTTEIWLRLGEGRHVSEAYLQWSARRPTLAWCDQDAANPPAGRERFIRFAARRAIASHRDYQIPISVSIAQAINESGWGRSSLTAQGNAYFGIKCFGTPGPIAAGCRPYRTSECDRSGCGPTVATFRVYPLASRSFLDHGRFLAVNPRYRPAFAHTGDPDRFAREIHRAGYATDPAYSDKLITLMRQHDLYRFDR